MPQESFHNTPLPPSESENSLLLIESENSFTFSHCLKILSSIFIIKPTAINTLTVYNDILLVCLFPIDSVKLKAKLHMGKIKCVKHNLIKGDRHLLDAYAVQRNYMVHC